MRNYPDGHEINDGTAMRRTKAKHSEDVAICLARYKRIARRDADHEDARETAILNAELVTRISFLSPAEQKAYYQGVCAFMREATGA